ncbi:MAG: hypothetical protein ACK5ZV_12040 [bacterium]
MRGLPRRWVAVAAAGLAVVAGGLVWWAVRAGGSATAAGQRAGPGTYLEALKADDEALRKAEEMGLGTPADGAMRRFYVVVADGVLGTAEQEAVLAGAAGPVTVSAEMAGQFAELAPSRETLAETFASTAARRVWAALADWHRAGMPSEPGTREALVAHLVAEAGRVTRSGRDRREAFVALEAMGALADAATREAALAGLAAGNDPLVAAFLATRAGGEKDGGKDGEKDGGKDAGKGAGGEGDGGGKGPSGAEGGSRPNDQPGK